MPTTPEGLPYPDPATDFLADGALAIRQLAEAVPTMRRAHLLGTDTVHAVPNAAVTTLGLGVAIDDDSYWSAAGGTFTYSGPSAAFLFLGYCRWEGNATGRRSLRLERAGATPIYQDDRNNLGGTIDVGSSVLGYMSTYPGATIALRGYQNSGGSLNAYDCRLIAVPLSYT